MHDQLFVSEKKPFDPIVVFEEDGAIKEEDEEERACACARLCPRPIRGLTRARTRWR